MLRDAPSGVPPVPLNPQVGHLPKPRPKPLRAESIPHYHPERCPGPHLALVTKRQSPMCPESGPWVGGSLIGLVHLLQIIRESGITRQAGYHLDHLRPCRTACSIGWRQFRNGLIVLGKNEVLTFLFYPCKIIAQMPGRFRSADDRRLHVKISNLLLSRDQSRFWLRPSRRNDRKKNRSLGLQSVLCAVSGLKSATTLPPRGLLLTHRQKP